MIKHTQKILVNYTFFTSSYQFGCTDSQGLLLSSVQENANQTDGSFSNVRNNTLLDGPSKH